MPIPRRAASSSALSVTQERGAAARNRCDRSVTRRDRCAHVEYSWRAAATAADHEPSRLHRHRRPAPTRRRASAPRPRRRPIHHAARRAVAARPDARAHRKAHRAAAARRLVRRKRHSRRPRRRLLHAARGLPLGELRLAGRAAPARRLRRSVAQDARQPARRRQDRSESIAGTHSRPCARATCSRPGHCSCERAASPTATASTVRASRRPRTSSTRTSPRNAIPARRSESGAARCSAVVADGRSPPRCRAHAGRARKGDEGARRAFGDEPRRRWLR